MKSAAESLGKKKKRRVIELPNGMRVVTDSDRSLLFEVNPEPEAAPAVTPDVQPDTPKSLLGFDKEKVELTPTIQVETLQNRVDHLQSSRATETERLLRRLAVENELRRLAELAEAERKVGAERRRADDEEAMVAILLVL